MTSVYDSNDMPHLADSGGDDATLVLDKSTMIRKAIRSYLEMKPDEGQLLPHIKSNIGFVFTDLDLSESRDGQFDKQRQARAGAGGLANCDRGGPEKASFFLARSIPISKGTIEILNEIHLIKKDDRVGASESSLFNKSPLTLDLANGQHNFVNKELLTLPDGFGWVSMNVDNDSRNLNGLFILLFGNYVEDVVNMVRHNFSHEYLRSLLQSPGYNTDWFCGVLVVVPKPGSNKLGKLVCFVSAIPAKVRAYDQILCAVEINFHCVHKKLRAKRMAPVLIKEITRRVNLTDILQALYTADVFVPKPVSTCRHFHRSLNPKKLIDVGFSSLTKNMNMSRTVMLYRLPEQAQLEGLRQMDPAKDMPQVFQLITDHMGKFDLVPQFNLEELTHWLSPVPNVIDTYVVERLSNPELKNSKKEILAFFSFYILPSTVMNHKVVKTAEISYNAMASDKLTLTDHMHDALIVDKNSGLDVFNALNQMENDEFLTKLKVDSGDNTQETFGGSRWSASVPSVRSLMVSCMVLFVLFSGCVDASDKLLSITKNSTEPPNRPWMARNPWTTVVIMISVVVCFIVGFFLLLSYLYGGCRAMVEDTMPTWFFRLFWARRPRANDEEAGGAPPPPPPPPAPAPAPARAVPEELPAEEAQSSAPTSPLTSSSSGPSRSPPSSPSSSPPSSPSNRHRQRHQSEPTDRNRQQHQHRRRHSTPAPHTQPDQNGVKSPRHKLSKTVRSSFISSPKTAKVDPAHRSQSPSSPLHRASSSSASPSSPSKVAGSPSADSTLQISASEAQAPSTLPTTSTATSTSPPRAPSNPTPDPVHDRRHGARETIPEKLGSTIRRVDASRDCTKDLEKEEKDP